MCSFNPGSALLPPKCKGQGGLRSYRVAIVFPLAAKITPRPPVNVPPAVATEKTKGVKCTKSRRRKPPQPTLQPSLQLHPNCFFWVLQQRQTAAHAQSKKQPAVPEPAGSGLALLPHEYEGQGGSRSDRRSRSCRHRKNQWPLNAQHFVGGRRAPPQPSMQLDWTCRRCSKACSWRPT